ncbi:MAG: branched-chain amino acid ABC transporter permease [Dehalococcoidia bacterium]
MDFFLQTLISGVGLAALYLMLSVGLTLLFGVLGIVNFAHGDFMTVAAYFGVATLGILGDGPIRTLLFMIPLLVLLGGISYFSIFSHLDENNHAPQILATFGMALIIRGVIQMIWGNTPVTIARTGGAYYWGNLVIPHDTVRNCLVAAVSVLLLWLILTRTRIGLEIQATSMDSVGAELIGINTRKIRLVGTLLASGMTAVGGLLLFTSRVLTPFTGFSLVLIAFAVVIVGGMGSVSGTVVASFALGTLVALVGAYAGSAYAPLVLFLSIIAVLLARPTGLAGAPAS